MSIPQTFLSSLQTTGYSILYQYYSLISLYFHSVKIPLKLLSSSIIIKFPAFSHPRRGPFLQALQLLPQPLRQGMLRAQQLLGFAQGPAEPASGAAPWAPRAGGETRGKNYGKMRKSQENHGKMQVYSLVN